MTWKAKIVNNESAIIVSLGDQERVAFLGVRIYCGINSVEAR
jgi:hypothetical protein